MIETSKASTYEQTTYRKDGVIFVPHFRNNSVFVGPGYPRHNKNTYTEAELVGAGAVKQPRFLWSRGTAGAVNNANP
jgi:hypothetical protein